MADISPVKTWGNEELFGADLTAEFSNVYSNHVSKSTAQTVSGRKTFTGGIVLDELVSVAAAGSGDVKLAEFRWDPASGTLTDDDGFYIDYVADDDAGNQTVIGRLLWNGDDVGDGAGASEDWSLRLSTIIAGTLTEQVKFGLSGNAIQVGVDDTGYDVQFFGATSGKYWQWDESADEMYVVGTASIGTLTPGTSGDGTLHVHSGSAGSVTANTNYDDVVIENSGIAGLTFLTPETDAARIVWGDPDDADIAHIEYDHSTNVMSFRASAADRLQIRGSGIKNIQDNSGFYTGVGDDGRFYHDGTNTIITTSTGFLNAPVGLSIGTAGTNTLIDDSSTGSGSTTLYIGNQSITTSSDVRVKRGFREWDGDALDFALSAPALSEYEYDAVAIGDESEHGPASRGTYLGWSAQEVARWAPWVVNAGDAIDCPQCSHGQPCDRHEHVWKTELEHLVPVLFAALQQTHAEVATLRERRN